MCRPPTATARAGTSPRSPLIPRAYSRVAWSHTPSALNRCDSELGRSSRGDRRTGPLAKGLAGGAVVQDDVSCSGAGSGIGEAQELETANSLGGGIDRAHPDGGRPGRCAGDRRRQCQRDSHADTPHWHDASPLAVPSPLSGRSPRSSSGRLTRQVTAPRTLDGSRVAEKLGLWLEVDRWSMKGRQVRHIKILNQPARPMSDTPDAHEDLEQANHAAHAAAEIGMAIPAVDHGDGGRRGRIRQPGDDCGLDGDAGPVRRRGAPGEASDLWGFSKRAASENMRAGGRSGRASGPERCGRPDRQGRRVRQGRNRSTRTRPAPRSSKCASARPPATSPWSVTTVSPSPPISSTSPSRWRRYPSKPGGAGLGTDHMRLSSVVSPRRLSKSSRRSSRRRDVYPAYSAGAGKARPSIPAEAPSPIPARCGSGF